MRTQNPTALAVAAWLLLLVGPSPLRAQASTDADAEAVLGRGSVTTAPVVVDGLPLFEVRGVSAFPAATRADLHARRILDAARNPEVDPEEIEIVVNEQGTMIMAGDYPFGLVLEADARLEDVAVYELAMARRESIKRAIQRYRAARTPVRLGTAAARAVAATAILVLLLALLLPLFRRIDRLIQRRWKKRTKELEEKSFELLRADRLQGFVRGLARVIRAAIVFVLVYLYLSHTLALFPWTRFIAVRLRAWILSPLRTIGQAIIADIPDIIFLIILAIVVRFGLKLLRLFFEGIDRGSIRFEGFEAEWAWPTYKIVRAAALAFTVVVAYPYIPGSGSEAFKGVSLFAGIVFSLGSTSAISNIVAGYTMTYRRAFRVGDRVKFGDTIGDVSDIRLQVTTLKTPKNEEVVIPNATILNSEIVNYTSLAVDKGLILHTTVGIGYEVPWRQVEAMLLDAAGRTPGLLEEPRPFVLQKALADYAVNYELNVYCSDPRQMMPLYSALHRNIQDVFNEHGVQIMTPSYVADTPDPKVVPKEQWYAAPARPPTTDGGSKQES